MHGERDDHPSNRPPTLIRETSLMTCLPTVVALILNTKGTRAIHAFPCGPFILLNMQKIKNPHRSKPVWDTVFIPQYYSSPFRHE